MSYGPFSAQPDVEGEKVPPPPGVCALRLGGPRSGAEGLASSEVRLTGQENKGCDLRELGDRYRYCWCETMGWPSPRWLARSQHHRWLGGHLFHITVPPLDLQLADENDTEFEDTFGKTLY